MEEKIKIGCPNCGAILEVKAMQGIEDKNVTCPVCRKSSPYANFKRKSLPAGDEHTQYPDADKTDYKEGETKMNTEASYALGTIRHGDTTFRLAMGSNIVGRKANGSKAHVQLTCTGKRMSREHLVIEVKKVQGVGIVHYVSLYKAQVNPTRVGNSMLEYGDKIVLKNHDIIKLPDMDVRFEIPDTEGTEF